MTRLAMLSATIAAAALCCGGCGRDPAEPTGPTTPADLVAELSRRAGAGHVDLVTELLSDDARNQTGRQWLQFVRRTGNERTLRGLLSLPSDARRSLEAARTRQFMQQFQSQAPDAFGKLFFDLYYDAHYEENGRLLVYMRNGRGYMVYLAMERQGDGTLKLLGETESDKVYKALKKKLDEARRKDAA